MPDRKFEIDSFLSTNGWQHAVRTPITSDASPRAYQRLTEADRNAMLMDAPPAKMSITPFLRIARHLKGLGFSTPEIYADDQTLGLVLIEDLGETSYSIILHADPNRERELYQLAVDVLSTLHRLSEHQAIAPGTPDYSIDILLEEVSRFILWYIPANTGEPLPTAEAENFKALWSEALSPVFEQPKTQVFRDFHIDNLIYLENRRDIERCGLLDFQDAVIGAGAYDLMSLLEDARRDIDDTLAAAMRERYFLSMEMSGPDQEGFNTAYAILGAQRHTKIIGLFVRLCVQDKKPVYLMHIPRVWRLLERSLCHPALSALKTWFDIHIPEDKRGIPPHLADTNI